MGVLTRIDAVALGRYCQLLARWLKAEAFIQEHGEAYPVKDRDGKTVGVVEFPQTRNAARLAEALTRLRASEVLVVVAPNIASHPQYGRRHTRQQRYPDKGSANMAEGLRHQGG